jgi:tryptophan-rich sensory protein
VRKHRFRYHPGDGAPSSRAISKIRAGCVSICVGLVRRLRKSPERTRCREEHRPLSTTARALSSNPVSALSTTTHLARSIASVVPTRTAISVAARPRGFSWGRYALRGLGAVVAAVLANTLFYYLGGALVAYDPDFIILSNPSGAAIFTVVPAIVAVLLYASLVRFARHPAAIFTVISAIVFVVTLIPDFTYIPTVPGASNAQTAVLVLMHVIAASVIVRLLTSTPARQPR